MNKTFGFLGVFALVGISLFVSMLVRCDPIIASIVFGVLLIDIYLMSAKKTKRARLFFVGLLFVVMGVFVAIGVPAINDEELHFGVGRDCDGSRPFSRSRSENYRFLPEFADQITDPRKLVSLSQRCCKCVLDILGGERTPPYTDMIFPTSTGCPSLSIFRLRTILVARSDTAI
jgi:hypothetical protein